MSDSNTAHHTIALMLTRVALTLTLLPVLTGSSFNVVAADATGFARATVVRAGKLPGGASTGDVQIRLPGSVPAAQASGSETTVTPAPFGAAAEALQENCSGDGCANLPDDGRLRGDPVYTLVLSTSQEEDDSRTRLVVMFN